MVGLSLVIALLGALALGAVAMGISWLRSDPTSVHDRMEDFVQRSTVVSLEEMELQLPFLDRIVRPLLEKASKVAEKLLPRSNVDQVRRDLLLAGSPGGLSPRDFLGARLIGALVVGVLGLFVTVTAGWPFVQMLLVSGVLAIVGSYFPVYWLRSCIASRQDEIIRALPNALDMLTICVDAGLPFDMAMLRIGDKWDNAVAQEFNRVVAEMRMGVSRGEALRHLAERTGVADVGNFVAVLIQADQLGVSVAEVLHIQSDQMRDRRHQRAEELANQAPVKMVFPLVFLILPALFIMILGPAVPDFIEALSALGGG